MSDVAVAERRALIKRKKRERIETQPPAIQGLTEEQRMMIRELMDAQMKTFDTTFSHFKNFRLPGVLSSGCEMPEPLQAPSREEAAKWSQVRKDLCSVKVSLQLRGEDGSVWNYKPPADNGGKEIFSLLPHMADMSTYMIKGIINFAKVISYFSFVAVGLPQPQTRQDKAVKAMERGGKLRQKGKVQGPEAKAKDLPIEDQISLLKGATFELCQLRFNTVFNAETGTWECGRLSYCLEDTAGGFQQLLLEPMLKFHYMLKKLQLHEEEYVLMQAISLFSPGKVAVRDLASYSLHSQDGRSCWFLLGSVGDAEPWSSLTFLPGGLQLWKVIGEQYLTLGSNRPGVVQHHVVDQLQEQFAITLKAYIECNRPRSAHRFLFLKIMAMLTELRSINAQHTQRLLRIQDIHPFATPLMQELFSITDS
ncbi:Nuclear receptor sub 1 group I member 2 [Saguinus oedipus]|uniref:Nuclear receptor sub 1 group I member 2 n=1 Tax=Saguinus oedipus TaxID=9490 RepID=A0ABQ9U3Z6_SAGOE|nr:Nuclear receptor sub 1 group I member 2 [Saguinus oedipus]